MIRGKNREIIRAKNREIIRGKNREIIRGKNREIIREEIRGFSRCDHPIEFGLLPCQPRCSPAVSSSELRSPHMN